MHFFHDLLRPCTTLSKVLQDQDLSVEDAIEPVMKTTRNVEQLQSTSLDEFPMVKKVMSQVRSTSDGMTYQGTRILHYDEGFAFLTAKKDEFFGLVSACLKNCVKSHHSELLKDILTLLATQGWEKSTTDFADAALRHLSDRFAIPLDKAGVDLSMLQEEWNET